MKVLLHTCCAPCSLSCIEPLQEEKAELELFWFNPNIHPYTEYKARRDCLLNYAQEIGLTVRVKENYGLCEFVKAVANNIENRCKYCYYIRMKRRNSLKKTDMTLLQQHFFAACIKTTRA